MDFVPKIKSVLREYVFLKNLYCQVLLAVKINVKIQTKYVLMANVEANVKSTTYVIARAILTVLFTITAMIMVLAYRCLNANGLKIVKRECFVKMNGVSWNPGVVTKKIVKDRMKCAIIANVFHVPKNVHKMLIVTTGIFVRIIDVLNAGSTTNAAMVTIAVKWDAKRTNVSKMKIAKKMGKFAKTKNADTFAKPSGIATFTSFAMEVYAHIRNVIGTVHAEGCRRT